MNVCVTGYITIKWKILNDGEIKTEKILTSLFSIWTTFFEGESSSVA